MWVLASLEFSSKSLLSKLITQFPNLIKRIGKYGDFQTGVAITQAIKEVQTDSAKGRVKYKVCIPTSPSFPRDASCFLRVKSLAIKEVQSIRG
jgi:hypothetical protein